MVDVGAAEVARLRYIMAHPMRARIIEALTKLGRPMCIPEIANELGIKRKLVSYHVLTLLQQGIVAGEYRPYRGSPEDEKGRLSIAKYYKLTPKAKAVIGLSY